MTFLNGNYKAVVTKTTNGYGELCFRVKVLLVTGTHVNGDVLFLREYSKAATASRAAQRELQKRAA